MKKIFYFIILGMILFTACNDAEILEPTYGEPIDPVTNLEYSISGNTLTITWDLPSSFPDDIIQPVSVYLVIDDGGPRPMAMVLGDAPESFIFEGYNPEMSYRITVKVRGDVDKDISEAAGGRYRLSLGQTIYF